MEADGTVVRLAEHRDVDVGSTVNAYYHAVYAFDAGGRVAEAESRVGTNPPKRSPGDHAKLFYDPDDPSVIYVPAERGTVRLVMRLFAVLGVAFAAAGSAMWALL